MSPVSWTVGGPEVFQRPARMLTREDLQRAKARLRKFAVVMMLDHFDEDSVQLAESLGWTQFEELYSDASDTLSSPFSEEQLHGPGPGSFILYRYEAYLHKAVEPSGSGQEGKDDQYDLLSGRSLNHVTQFLLAQAEGCNLPALWRPGGSQNPEPVEEDSGVTGSYFSKRRTKQLSFTCKLCHARMTKLINPHAWERGAIVVRCDGCGVKHQLVDNLGVFDLLQPKDKRDQGREPPRHLWN